MRTSGALKSLIHGVSTDDKRLRNKKYLAEQTNIQTVESSGLHKRPPAELVAVNTFDNYINNSTHKSIIKSFLLGSVTYYFTLKYLLADITLAPTIKIYTALGTSQTLDKESADYFKNVTKKSDLSIQTQQDTVFIVNKTKTTAMEAPTRTNEKISLIHILQSPFDSEELKINFFDIDESDIQIDYTASSLSLQARGTKQVAIDIAAEITASAAVGVTATTRGSIVAITRSDSVYATITTEDQSNDNVLLGINGILNDIQNLPAWTAGQQILKIQPQKDKDRGVFYMKSEVVEEYDPPVLPTKDTTITSGLLHWGGEITTGYSKAGSLGAMSPILSISTIEVASILLTTGGTIEVRSNPGSSLPVDWIERILITNSTSTIIIDVALLWNDGGTGTDWFSGTIAEDIQLVENEDYDIYFDQSAILNSTFKKTGWVESSKPDEPYMLDAATMPHTILIRDNLEIDTVAWDDKSAGDNETNPNPGFIGRTIKTLAIFQNRLIALENDEVTSTETDNNRSWFRNTVTQLLPTHPLRLRSTSPDSDTFHSKVNHNKDLLLFSKKSQFKLPGNRPLNPATQGIPQTSSYINNPTVEPVSIGKNVFFSFNYGAYSGISKYTSDNDENLPDRADPITDHVKTYMSGTSNLILGDENLGILYAIHDETIYVCDYNPKKLITNETPRFAWSKWITFAGDTTIKIEDATLIANKLQLVLTHGNTADIVQLNIIQSPVADTKQTYLDYLNTGVTVNNILTPPTDYPTDDSNLRVVYAIGEDMEGARISFTESAGVLTLDTEVQDGTNVVYGLKFKASLTPSTIYVRDEGGHVNPFTKLSILKWLIHLTDSADVSASIISSYYNISDQYWSGLISNNINTQTDDVADNSDTFHVGYKQRADLAKLQIHSSGHLPMNITGIDWLGNYTSRGRRF